MGYAEVNINESKEVNIVLDTPYYEIPLTAGWNLISLPLVQSDTSIPAVLNSIAGNYIIVQWYNASDGKWHSTNDDLTDINHTMGFWIYMKTADTLIVNGAIPNTTSIQLCQGWNMVGYPSLINRTRGNALNNINFGSDVDAIWTFDAATQTWHEIGPSDYFELGRGYWIHSKVTKVWVVPL